MLWIVLSVVFIFHSGVCDGQGSRIVNTDQGPVRGYRDPEYAVYVFHGIPYATAPTGIDRFKAPRAPPVWKVPFEAVNKDIVCPQFDADGALKGKNVQEDCLVTNIYVPDSDKDKLPVVVYIHAGAFIMGYGNSVDPRHFVDSGEVIIVTFNYRLAGIGFLCLGTKDIPGNAGLKDQVALLRWVHRNIAYFGGNPDDVTLAGSSAGSASTDLLMISKVTQGLFTKGIIESGFNVAPFAVQRDPIESAKDYANLLKAEINVNDLYALEEFFLTIPVERLNSVYTLNRTDATTVLAPCIERDNGEEIILDDCPVKILKSGNFKKVPMLYGLDNMEGLMRLGFIAGELEKDMEAMHKNFSHYLPSDLHFESGQQRNEVAKKIKNYYFGERLDKSDVMDYVYYFTDIMFATGMLRSAKLQLEAGNKELYLYEYSFADESTPYVPFTKIRGANHFDHCIAIWGSDKITKEDDEKASEEFKRIRNGIRKLWLNFMKSGNPNSNDSNLPEWPPAGKKLSPHMSISKAFELRGSLLKERGTFWKEIYTKFYRPPRQPKLIPPKRVEL